MEHISTYFQRGLVDDVLKSYENVGCNSVTEFCRMAVIVYYNRMCEGMNVSPYQNLTVKYRYQSKDYPVTVTLESDILHKIRRFCEQHGHSASGFVREAVAYYISEVGQYKSYDTYKYYVFTDFINDLYKMNLLDKYEIDEEQLADIRKGVKESKALTKAERDILNRYIKYLINERV